MRNNTIEAFFALIKGGLWEQDVMLSQLGAVDYDKVYRLASEQSVVGLLAAGIEHIIDDIPPKALVLEIVGESLQLEQRNSAMNLFVAGLVEKMRKADIYTLLLKGQGIAQCYERPLWRTCGDIDFFLSDSNYTKAKFFLAPLASNIEPENEYDKHIGYTIDTWIVELHGSLRGDVLYKIDKVLDEVEKDVFYGGDVRSWINNGTQVFIPGINNDIIFVFSHILDHFFHGGIGIRQICDWCRLLWVYKDKIDVTQIETRLKAAGIMTEWLAFAALAVNYLGISSDAVPLYDDSKKWSAKAKRIVDFIILTGNFGHNRDKSYYLNRSYITRKIISLCRHTSDSIVYLQIFPLDSIKIWAKMLVKGVKEVFKYKKI